MISLVYHTCKFGRVYFFSHSQSTSMLSKLLPLLEPVGVVIPGLISLSATAVALPGFLRADRAHPFP